MGNDSTALTVWQPPGLPTRDEYEIMKSMAITYAKAGNAVRPSFRGNPEACFVAISVGRELGIPPTLALTKGYVIDGGFQLDADILGDVVRRNIPGLSWEEIERNDQRVTIKGGIAGGREHTVTFEFATAEAAGWTKASNGGLKANWQPGARQDTMYAKCVRRLVKRTGGLWASIYTADPEEYAEGEPPRREPSSATVVEEPSAVLAGDGVTPVQGGAEPATQGPVHADPPKVDWHHRLLVAAAVCWSHAAMPPATGAKRTAWAKKHADDLLRLINLYYAERGEGPAASFAMVPPHDAKPIAEWLEEKNAKRAGGQAETPVAPTEGNPARDAGPVPGQAGVPVDDEEAPPATDSGPDESVSDVIARRTTEISAGDVGDLLFVLDDLRRKVGNGRQFYMRHETSGNPYLIDSEILEAIGLDKKVGQKLANLWGNEPTRIMLSKCVATLEQGETL